MMYDAFVQPKQCVDLILLLLELYFYLCRRRRLLAHSEGCHAGIDCNHLDNWKNNEMVLQMPSWLFRCCSSAVVDNDNCVVVYWVMLLMVANCKPVVAAVAVETILM